MESPARFITRPTQTMAMQWTGDNTESVKNWVGNAFRLAEAENTALLWVASVAHYVEMEPGDWIVQNELGFYPRKEESFRQEYRKMLDDEAVTVEFGHVFFPGGAHSAPTTSGIPLVSIHPGDEISTDADGIWIDTADGKRIPLRKAGK